MAHGRRALRLGGSSADHALAAREERLLALTEERLMAMGTVVPEVGASVLTGAR
jgi:hypothetical protein